MMNRELLQAQGFEGFMTMGELMDGARTLIPNLKGVYVVLRESDHGGKRPFANLKD